MSHNPTPRLTPDAYAREAVEYTTAMVERLNADVRADPSLGQQSTFFRDPANVARGLPVFQGKHTRFVYDDEDNGDVIVAAVDVTHEPTTGPRVRTVADYRDHEDDQDPEDIEDHDQDNEINEDEDDDDDYDEEEDENVALESHLGREDVDMGVHNEFYPEADADADERIRGLLEDVAMELSTVALEH